jgi:hypothetical protein
VLAGPSFRSKEARALTEEIEQFTATTAVQVLPACQRTRQDPCRRT